MNDYLRSSELVLNTKYPGYSFEIEVEEGIRLMNEINKEKFNISYYGMWAGNKYRIVPKELIFQDEKTTIINWTDGTKTIVKCSDDNVFSPEAGIALCYMKRFMTDNDAERFHRLLKGLVSISKFKNSKREEKHDIDTGTPNNAGDNNSDNPSMEVV